MRDFKRGLLFLPVFVALLATLALSNAGSVAADSPRLAAQQTPLVNLEVTVEPQSIEPGQQAVVTVTITNVSNGPIAPEISILLPPSLSAKMSTLPAGTLFNAQSGAVNWQPVMGGDGSEIQLALPVVAQVAATNGSEQLIGVVIQAGGAELRQDVGVWVGLAPTASIRLNPPQVAVGQSIQLIGETTGPDSVAQIWSLGDGRIVEAENPEVVYPYPGAYEVVFQMSTPVGVISTRSVVNVVPRAIARFTMSDSTPAVGVPVQFVNESGGQQPLTYLWDFGDGVISTDVNAQHAFATAGPFDVRLYVTGANGQSETIQTLNVGAAPVADFVIADVVDAGAIVQGQAFTDESATSIAWDMGDGRVYEGQDIQHVYWAAGEYPVTVTVANEFGETRLMRSVHVNAGPALLYLPLIVRPDGYEAAPETIPSEENQLPQPEVDRPQELPLLDLPPDLSPQAQLLAYVNEARRINGLAALNQVPELSAAAQSHTDDMALSSYTGHTGSDGSVPALRVLLSGYPGGYAGEATAWGMEQAVEPVRFWLTSPAHRAIILNPAASDVGVGYTVSFEAPSVWYWTAEFASLDLPVVQVPLPPTVTPVPEQKITLLGPPSNAEFVMSPETNLIFTWSWPTPVADGERFGVYLNTRGRTIQLGTVRTPQSGDQYHFATVAGNVPALPGQQFWFVRLEETLTGALKEESEMRPIAFVSAPQ
jgi:PKD repeat protein